MKVFALRLNPNQDLRQELKQYAIAHQIQAGFILSAIGSFKQVSLRFADQPASTILIQKYELLSLNGTLSMHGLHLHMTIADSSGQLLGGHVADGCIIYTTAEIVLGKIENLQFIRQEDEQTGFSELKISHCPEVMDSGRQHFSGQQNYSIRIQHQLQTNSTRLT